MVSKPFIGGTNAAELRRRGDVLATTSKAKKQQIARLSRLAIATTGRRNLKNTETKEFIERNRANEGNSVRFVLICMLLLSSNVPGGKTVPFVRRKRGKDPANTQQFALRLHLSETMGAEQKVNPPTELSGCTAEAARVFYSGFQ